MDRALERINNAGLKRQELSTADSRHTTRRFTVAAVAPSIELRRRVHNLPILCDPSRHIGGSVANFHLHRSAAGNGPGTDGLIVESHCNPDCAWVFGTASYSRCTRLHPESVVIHEHQSNKKLARTSSTVDACDNELMEISGQT